MPNPLTLHAYHDWEASCELLNDSLSRYIPYSAKKKYTSQELEFYDSLSFRYTKAIETAFYFFRAFEVELTGVGSQFQRDQLLKMEKVGIVKTVDEWMDAKQLRNKITHTYDPDELEIIFVQVINHSRAIIEAAQRAKTCLK